MDGHGMAVSLRGLHLFAHPVQYYDIINNIKPRGWLLRNLSYAARPVGTAGSSNNAGTRRELHVSLTNLRLRGYKLPREVTFLVVLCEAASTGQDFRPVRAAGVTLQVPGDSEGVEVPEGQGPAPGPGSAQRVVLPLPLRQLTRPVLMVIVSDRYPELTIFFRHGGRARPLRTDHPLLLGLLPDPCDVWAAVHPLGEVLGVATSAGGASSSQPHLPSAQPVVPLLPLLRSTLTRSICSVTNGSGRTLVATLLNLRLGRTQQQLGGDGGVRPQAASEAADAAAGITAAGAHEEDGEEDEKVERCGVPGRTIRLRALAVGCAVEVKAVEAALATATTGPGGRAAAPAGATSEDNRDDTVVEFRYVFDDPAWTDLDAMRRRRRRQQQLRNEQQIQQQEEVREASKGTVGNSKRRHGTDDEMVATPTAAAAGVSAAAARGAAGSGVARGGRREREQERARWMQGELDRIRLERDGETATAAAVAAAEGGGTGRRGARAAGGVGGSRGPTAAEALAAGPGTWEATAAASADKGAAATERFFSEEMRVAAGGLFACPLCPVQCRSLQGLQTHLPASHSLYSYSFFQDEAPPDQARHEPQQPNGTRQDPQGGAPRRHVVEVRLHPGVVDPERHDIVKIEEERSNWVFFRRVEASRRTRRGTREDEGLQADAGADMDEGFMAPPDDDQGPDLDLDGGIGVAQKAEAEMAAVGRASAEIAPGGGAGGSGSGAGVVGTVPPEPGPQAGRRRARRKKGLETAEAAAAGAAGAGEGAGRVAGGGAAGGGSGRGNGAAAQVRVSVEALVRSFAAGAFEQGTAAADGGAPAAAAAAVVAAAGRAAMPPAAFAAGSHPPGRRYFHSRSALAGTLDEMFGPHDSEDDETDDEEWEAAFERNLAHTTRFTPLQGAERQFMKLWNASERRRPLFADYIMPFRCLQFAREHGPLFRSDPALRDALTVHMLLLNEFNLIDPRTILRCAQIADGRITTTEEEDEQFLANQNAASTSGRDASDPATAAQGGRGAGRGAGVRGRRGGGRGRGGPGGRGGGRGAAAGAAGADGGASEAAGNGLGDGGAGSGAGGGGADGDRGADADGGGERQGHRAIAPGDAGAAAADAGEVGRHQQRQREQAVMDARTGGERCTRPPGIGTQAQPVQHLPKQPSQPQRQEALSPPDGCRDLTGRGPEQSGEVSGLSGRSTGLTAVEAGAVEAEAGSAGPVEVVQRQQQRQQQPPPSRQHQEHPQEHEQQPLLKPGLVLSWTLGEKARMSAAPPTVSKGRSSQGRSAALSAAVAASRAAQKQPANC